MKNSILLLPSLASFVALAPSALAQGDPVTLWESSLLSPGLYDQVGAMLSDGDDGAWVLSLIQVTSQRSEFNLSRIAPDGSTIWIESFGADGFNEAELDLCTDGAGGVFVGGSFFGQGFAGPELGLRDGFIARFGPSGSLLWARRVGGNDFDSVRATEPDGAGGVVVCGATQSADFGVPVTSAPTEGFVARYDSTGAETWVTRVDFGSGGGSDLLDLVVDPLGAVFAVGRSAGLPGPFRGAVARLDLGGGVTWARPSVASNTSFHCVTSDGAGGVVAAGVDVDEESGRIVRLDGSGAQQNVGALSWSSSGSFRFMGIRDIVRLPGGSYVVAGTGNGNTPSPHARTRYLEGRSANLGQLWTEQFDVEPGVASGLWAVTDDGRGGLWTGGALAPGPNQELRAWAARLALSPLLGQPGCAGQRNSTGSPAESRIAGSPLRFDNGVTVATDRLPAGAFGFYVASLTPAFTPGAGGGDGDLCIGGAPGRFNGPGQVLQSSGGGRFHLRVDLDAFPTPTGVVSVAAGETWYFQAWYRDNNPAPTSNFSSSVSFTTN